MVHGQIFDMEYFHVPVVIYDMGGWHQMGSCKCCIYSVSEENYAIENSD